MLTIEKIKAAIIPICERYGVDKVCLFGSYARDEADEQSDVDLFVDGGKLVGFEWGGLKLDVLSRRGTRQKFLNKIAKDEVLLYIRDRHFRQGATE